DRRALTEGPASRQIRRDVRASDRGAKRASRRFSSTPSFHHHGGWSSASGAAGNVASARAESLSAGPMGAALFFSGGAAVERVIAVDGPESIFPRYRGTPIGRLLEYHNLQRSYDAYTQAELLIGMCMDNRKHLSIPDNFAYILRAGGANMRPAEFKVS